MATSATKQALRQYRRENGLCIFCGDPAIAGQTRCADCAADDSARRKTYAARDQALGICRNTGCSNRVTGAKHYCDACNSKSAARTGRRRRGRVDVGLCSGCGKEPRWNGLTRCEACNNKMKKSNAALVVRRIAAGLCRTCGEPVDTPGYTSCAKCIARRNVAHFDLKTAVLAAYGGPICVGCRETERYLLTIDHIGGGGHAHAIKIGNGDHVHGRAYLYRWLKANGYPAGFRVLCWNCNIRARYDLPFPNPIEQAVTPISFADAARLAAAVAARATKKRQLVD